MKIESDNNNKKGLQKTDLTNLNEISSALTPLVNYPLINKSIIQNVIKSQTLEPGPNIGDHHSLKVAQRLWNLVEAQRCKLAN